MNKNIPKGLVFNIQSFSVHDGPGARTTVFMSNCPLSCKWCCNPEGLFNKPIMMHSTVKCQLCGDCVKACPHNALTFDKGKLLFNRTICNTCNSMECVSVCRHEGNILAGTYYSIEDLMHRFKRERPYWGEDGGITLSGGEPLLQKKFALALLKECRKQYIHTCIETTAYIESSFWLEAINYIDWIFVDIKHMNTDKHKSYVGVNNELILKNISLLCEEKQWNGIIIPRIPVIPSFNDDDENIRKTASFVRKLDIELINILPFHNLGESKYRQLNHKYEFENVASPTDERMHHLKSLIEEEGLMCFIGYNTPF